MGSREKNKKCESRRDQVRRETNMFTDDSNGIGSCVYLSIWLSEFVSLARIQFQRCRRVRIGCLCFFFFLVFALRTKGKRWPTNPIRSIIRSDKQ